VTRETGETNFGEFYALFAARHLLDAVRRDVLSGLERVLSKEIDVNAPRAFASAMAEARSALLRSSMRTSASSS
jgi:hypothetical protein